MVAIAKLFNLCRLSQFSIAQAFGTLVLALGLLAGLAAPQLAFAQTQITNTASISPPLGVTNTNSALTCVAGTCTAADNDTVTASVPTVSKTFISDTINAGGTSLLVITFTNTHKLVTATFANEFIDAYPSGMLNAATPLAATTCLVGAPSAANNGTQISLPAGTQIAPNGSCSVSVVVTSSTSPQPANTIPAGSLTTNVGANPTLVNAVLTVNLAADLQITKTTANPTPNAGGTFTYVIVIGNNGPSPVSNATWTDSLPAGLGTIANIVTQGGITANGAGTAVISGTSTLAVGDRATVTFQVSVAPGATGVLFNTATVATPGGTTELAPGNNSSAVSVTVNLTADMAITKTASTLTPNAGGTFTYTIVIGNNGPSNVTNATWTDTLPSGLGTITNITTNGATAVAAGNTISGTSSLLAGQVATVTFQVTVAPGATGTQTNTATVTPPPEVTELVPGNNASTSIVTVGLVANLSVTKTDGVASVVAGGTTAYTIVYSNGGPSAANGALVKDAVTPGLVCVSVTCTATTGGASCPSSLLPQGTAVLAGATNFFGTGETIGTFPANSSVTLVANCNVTATGQ